MTADKEEMELIQERYELAVSRIREIRDAESGEAMTSVSVAGRRVRIPCGLPLEAGDFIRGINRNHQV